MKEPGTFYGYTIEQIRKMDAWFRLNNLSWEILAEQYKKGFEAGVEADRQMIDDHLKELMAKLGSKQPVTDKRRGRE